MFSFVTEDNISGKDFLAKELILSFCDAYVISFDETEIPVNLVSGTIVITQDTSTQDTNTAIKENNWFQGLSVYPNPTNGNLVVVLPQIVEEAHVNIVNNLGQQVYGKKLFYADKTELSLPFLKPGIYFISVVTDEATFKQKFFKR